MRKKHFVMPRSPQARKAGVKTSKGTLKFGETGGMWVDPDIANEIEHTDGLKGTREVWTHEDVRTNHEMTYKPDGVHGYFFGPTAAFANAWDEFQERRRLKENGIQPKSTSKRRSRGTRKD